MFNAFQNHTPLTGRTAAVGKWVYIPIIPSTRAVSWSETPQIVTYSPRAFIWYIYWLCFEEVSEITCYNVELSNWVCLDLRAGPTEAQNQKLRLPPNSFQYHESSSSLKILKRASIIKHIFWGKLVALFYVKIWFVHFSNSVLGNEHTPELILMSKV